MRAACLGGGGGLVQVVKGLIDAGAEPTAIVGVTDSGRSTGLVRSLFDIPAPGDLRSVIAAMAADRAIADLLDYRLDTPTMPVLSGTAFGNLLIGTLAQQRGDFGEAIRTTAAMARVRAPVLPVSLANVQLRAELADGSIVTGEVQVRAPGKAAIRRVIADGPAPITPAAAEAITQADLVVLGPGSLFTSVLACLAINGVPEAIRSARAPAVFIANSTTQPGQSDALSLANQIVHVANAVGGPIVALVNSGEPDPAVVARHAGEGRTLLRLDDADRGRLERDGIQVVDADLVERDAGDRQLWNKADTIRHDPARLARALIALAKEPA